MGKQNIKTAKTKKTPVEIIVAKIGLTGTLITATLGLIGVMFSAYLGYVDKNKSSINESASSSALYTGMARTYIPTELELPKGFRVKVDTATNTFPTGECNGDEYEIDYVNENPFSPDGKVVLFRVAVCPDETKALDTFNSGFYTIWPWHFLYSISDGRTGFEWIFQPAKYDFKLNNVDNKLLIEGITQEKDTQKMLGATTTAVARSKNVVVVVIVYVQGMNKATNQAIYYLSLVIEKLQQGQR